MVRIVVNYTPDQEGQDIRDVDVIRPSNHRWCDRGGDEIKEWKCRSNVRCPTYGSCEICYKSGPVGKDCNECPPFTDRGPIYQILKNQKNILDSMTIAEMLNKGHETAKADRDVNSQDLNRLQTFNDDHAGLAVSGMYRNVADSPIKQETMRRKRAQFYHFFSDTDSDWLDEANMSD